MVRNKLTDASTTLSSSSVPILAADSLRGMLLIHNPSAAASVAVNLTGGTAAISTAGSVTLGPLATLLFQDAVPTSAVSAISNSTAVPITVQTITNVSV